MNWRGAAVVVAALASVATAGTLDPELKKMAKDPDSFKRSDAARALAKDGSPEAARILVELLSDRSPYVRDYTVLACDDVKDSESVKVLASAAKSKEELTRRNCADALGRTKSDAALAALETLATKDASPQVRADALDALGRFKAHAKAAAIACDGAGDKDPSVRAAAVEAAGRVGGDGAADVVRKALSDADEGVRCVARMELKWVARAEALAGLADAVKDASWRVRAQCVDDAAWLRDAPAMEALVALLGDRVTRVAASAHRALQQISGKDLGRDAELWAAWWNANKAAWAAPKGDLGRDAAGDPRKTSAKYHGLDVATDAGAFVADLSGSMKEPVGGAETRSRWVVVAEELRRTLGTLPDTFVANLVFFQNEPHKAFPRPQPLTRAAREKAEAFIAGGSPGQPGDLLAGVLAALEEDAVDTVFVLSDGAPSGGDIVEKSRVRAAIRQRNRTRKCVIDAIGFGARKSTERSFMEGLARDSGGRAVFRGDGGR